MFKKSGGGAITGTITGLEFESKEWESSKKGGDSYTTLTAKLLITPDGANVAAERYIRAGFLHEGEAISEDKQTLEVEGDDDAQVIQDNCDFARFVTSAIDKGFPADRIPENGRNFSALIGLRAVIKNEVDKEATEKFGKQVGKKGKSKGKEFDRTYLVVDKILELPTEGGKKASKSASKPAAAAKAAPKASAAKASSKPAAVEAEDDDITEQAKVALLTMLSNAKGNSIPKGQLSSALIKYALGANIEGSQREAIRAVLTGDDFLGLEDGWSVDGKNIVLAA